MQELSKHTKEALHVLMTTWSHAQM